MCHIDTVVERFIFVLIFIENAREAIYSAAKETKEEVTFVLKNAVNIQNVRIHILNTGWSCDDPCEQCWDSLRKHPPRHS